MTPSSAVRSGSAASILWPITVVGGSIAIAAFGVLGLYLLGNPGGEEVYAGDMNEPNGAITSSLPIAARALSDPVEGRSSQLLRKDDASGDSQNGGTESGSTDDAGDEGTGMAADRSDPKNGDAGEPGSAPTTTTQPSASADREPPGVTTTATPPARAEEPVGPAVFATRNLRTEPMASLVATETHLLTSASALAGRTRVFLRVNARWFDAKVAASDLASDIAVIVPPDDEVWQHIPSVSAASTAVQHGSRAYVGYCRSDMAAVLAAVTEADSIDPEPAGTSPRTEPTIGSTALPGPGCGDGTGPVATPPEPESEQEDEDEVLPPTTKSAPKPPNGWDRGADGVDRDDGDGRTDYRSDSAEAERREGGVISTVDPARTLSNRIIYDPIRTGIHRSKAVAGAPLRDAEGRIIGVVIGSPDSVVSALPIERAVAVADSLMDLGAGSAAWLGVDGRLTPVGFEVVGLHPESPAVGFLEPGDVILTVGSERLQGWDHLIHLVRTAGVGQDITVSLQHSGGQRTTVELQIVDRPDPVDPPD